MKQIILPVTVHLNIRLPLALLQPEPADAPSGPEPEAHACQGCGNCGGCRKCKHEKSKLNPSPSWTTASTAERGGWYMSAATMTVATVSRWTMGRNVSASSPFPTPCCAGGSGRRCCRWTGNWKRPCSTAWTPNGAPSAGRCSPQAPTGPNTAGMCAESPPAQKAECERRRRVQRGQLEGKNPL